jgi:hypothetical protein
MLDAIAFFISASVLGSFAFWLIAYCLWEIGAYLVRGPSEQLKSVGHSVLDEPVAEFEPSQKRAA